MVNGKSKEFPDRSRQRRREIHSTLKNSEPVVAAMLKCEETDLRLTNDIMTRGVNKCVFWFEPTLPFISPTRSGVGAVIDNLGEHLKLSAVLFLSIQH